MDNIIKTAFAALVTFITYVFGPPDLWLYALILAVIIDYTTGLLKAYILGQLSSKIGFKGICKKIMYFAIVAVAVIADNVTGAGGVLRIAVIGFLIANEALSILENCAAAELPVPKILLDALHKLKEDK